MRHLIKHDFTEGMKNRWTLYLIPVLVAVCVNVSFSGAIQGYGAQGNGTVMDYLMRLLGGIEAFKLEKNSNFIVPVEWLSLYIPLAYIVGYYAERDLKEYGIYTLMGGKTRMGWFFSKCIWCFGSVTAFFLVLIVITIICTLLFHGKFSFQFTDSIMNCIQSGTIFLGQKEALLITLGLTVAMTFAVSMLQMVMSLIVGSVNSYAGVCVLYIISTYWTSPLLVGNYMMWQRNDVVIPKEGVDTTIGFFIAGIILVSSFIIGILYIERYDVLSDHK